MILLQSALPCSENYYRYKKNYEKYMGQNKSQENSPKEKLDSADQSKTIASPRLMSKLSPITSMANLKGISFNPSC